LLVSFPGAVMGEDVITQVPGLVTGTEGQSVTLNCTEHATGLGAVKWSRDTGRGSQLFFNTGGDIRNPCVSFILENHLTDKSIRIDNLTLGDSGVYYCDKYRPGSSSEIAVPGPGVTLTVTGECLQFHSTLSRIRALPGARTDNLNNQSCSSIHPGPILRGEDTLHHTGEKTGF
ncbi:SIRBL protein, partial [Atractosteus spatula]|nr:SIRBL protein [Atractosteus spatula]